MSAGTLHPQWFVWPAVQRAIHILEAAGVPFAFAGGAVRNALVDFPPYDFNVAVGCAPQETEALLKKAGMAFERIPTRHFVYRAPIMGEQFDFAHLAAATPGLAFMAAMQAYARAADFTVNGMFLLPSGELHDETGAVVDLREGRIRFIEEPTAKMKSQPYLPLPLRYFRFLAWYGKGEPDRASFEAAITFSPQMANIENRFALLREMGKLLSAPSPYAALTLMQRQDVLRYAIGFSVVDLSLLESLAAIEGLLGVRCPWQVRLAALLLSADQPPAHAFSALAEYWRMEPDVGQKLSELIEHAGVLELPLSAEENERLIKTFGKNTVRDMLVLRWALEDDVEAAKERYLKAMAAIA